MQMDLKSYSIDPNTIQFVDPEQDCEQWFNIVAGYRNLLIKSSSETWLLFESDSFMFSAMFYALLSAGKSIVLPQNAQPEHIREIKKRVQASIGSAVIDPDIVTTNIWPKLPMALLHINSDVNVTFFTSGSTGQAKVVEKQFWQLQTEICCLETNFGATVKDSVLLSTVSHQHIYGLLFKILWPISEGHAFVCQAFEYPEHIANKITAGHLDSVTLIASPAHLHRLCLDNPLLPLKQHVRCIFSSGGPLDADKNISLQQQLECDLFEVYGSTETGGIGWRHRDSIRDEVWQTFAGVSVAQQPNTELLLLSSPYLKQNPFYGDDRIELINGQQFRLLGRADDIVKIEEKRISLREVQLRCKQHEYVQDVGVIVIGTQRKQLAAVIELNDLGKEAKDTMPLYLFNRLFRAYLAQWFEAVTLPKKFRYPLQIPYNAQGKLNRQAMESYFE
ncbi:AMP-binding protein [uncultured Paraglaciecola sp.]|uniref:AMP-binding protein n=1 Tax=uncultured Paraglaciecola sp. TaxID=1765024 RepID=UPI0030DBDCEC|tara:strand:- start:33254 stop:34594 length:1341 start_codon:yes stop_codon:yes gene_type:complete